MKKTLFFIPVLFLLIFFYIPLVTMLREAFLIDEQVSLQNFTELLSSPYHRHVIFFTIKQSIISLFFTLLLGIPAAYIFTRFSFPGKKIIRPLFLIPFVLPSIIVALGFILLYGQNGYLNQFLSRFNLNIRILYRLEAIILAHSFYNFPIVLKFVSDSWQRINQNYIAAARTLGASKLRIFFRITLPSLIPSIINASVLVFIYCFMSFGIVLILGSVNYTTIEVNIYILINHLIRFPLGMALGSIQLLFSLVFLFLALKSNRYYLKHLNLLDIISQNDAQIPLFKFRGSSFRRNIARVIITAYLLILIVIIIGPLLATLLFGIRANFQDDLITGGALSSVFDYNQILGSSVATALYNSALIAFSAASFTVILSLLLTQGIIYLEKRPSKISLASLLELFIIIPLIVSPVTFSLGYLRYIHFGVIDINRLLLIVFAHTVIAIPFVSRIVLQAIRNIPGNQINIARTLGTGRIGIFFRIILPQIKTRILLAFSFAFALSLGELGAVMMLGRNYVTIPMAIYRFIGARRLVPAVNMGILLLVVTFAFFFLIERLSEQNSDRKS